MFLYIYLKKADSNLFLIYNVYINELAILLQEYKDT